jgi:hypothetical protein
VGCRYFLRLWIRNDGSARAKDVEVFLLRGLKERKNDVFEEMVGFAPMNLRWSYGDYSKPTIYVSGISPRMGRYCDFVAVSDPVHPDLRGLPDADRTRIAIQNEFFGPAANWPGPGRFKFEVLVAASNRRPATYVIDFRLTGFWSENEAEMFQSGFVVSVAKG